MSSLSLAARWDNSAVMRCSAARKSCSHHHVYTSSSGRPVGCMSILLKQHLSTHKQQLRAPKTNKASQHTHRDDRTAWQQGTPRNNKHHNRVSMSIHSRWVCDLHNGVTSHAAALRVDRKPRSKSFTVFIYKAVSLDSGLQMQHSYTHRHSLAACSPPPMQPTHTHTRTSRAACCSAHNLAVSLAAASLYSASRAARSSASTCAFRRASSSLSVV
jgi:hypothetical protein